MERVPGTAVPGVSMVTSIIATIHVTATEVGSRITETGRTTATVMDVGITDGTVETAGTAAIADVVMIADVVAIAAVAAITAEIAVDMAAGTDTENNLNRTADKLPHVCNANMGRFAWICAISDSIPKGSPGR